MKKKGAIELSIGTIVIIVLAMTMLILGLVLIRSIFTGATYNVEQMNEKVQNEINKLFVEDKEMVVYLSSQKAEIKQGSNWGVAWAIKNLKTGVAEASKMSYDVIVSDDNIKKNCGINEATAESWIVQGQSESNIPIAPGKTQYRIIRISVPSDSPLCIVRYRIDTKLDGQQYASEFFDVQVTA
jgi:hypothetical protein